MEAYPKTIWKEYKFQILIVIATSAIVYLNTFGNGFVFDDNSLILRNHWIRDITFLPDIFTNNAWAFQAESSGNYYRPLMHVVYMLGYAISGLQPWGYHLLNVLLYICTSVLVFLLAEILFHDKAAASKGIPIPLMAGVIFAVHPIHTEAVAWVAGIPDLSYSLFCLLSLYLYIKSENRFNRYYFVSVTAFFVGTLFKEPALSLIVFLIAYDLLLNKNKMGSSLLLKRHIPFFLAASAYLGIRYFVLSGSIVPERTGHAEYGLYDTVIIVSTYIKQLVIPYKLQIVYSFRPVGSLFEPRMLVALFVIALVIAFYYLCFKRDKLAFFFLLIILTPLIPCLYVKAISGPSLLAERYLYLPSAGYAVLLSMIISRVGSSKGTAVAVPAFLLLTALFSVGTINRNADWKDDYSMWSDAVKKSPDNATAHDNLGAEYEKKGQYELAEAEFLAALKGYPIEVDAYKNLGITYKTMGRLDESIAAFSEYLRVKPNDANAHNDLGTVYIKKDDLERAKEHFQAAARLNPSKTIFRRNLEKVQQEMQ